MNWLIYIGGWFLGAFTFGYLTSSEEENPKLIIILISWTMTWFWICWRFING